MIIMNKHTGYASAGIPELARWLRWPAFVSDGWSLFDARQFGGIRGLRYGTLGTPFQGR